MLAVLTFTDGHFAAPRIDASYADSVGAREFILVRSVPWSGSIRTGASPPQIKQFICPFGLARQINVGLQQAQADWIWVLPALAEPSPPLLEDVAAIVRSDQAKVACMNGYTRTSAWRTRLACLSCRVFPSSCLSGVLLQTVVLRSLGGADERLARHRVLPDLARRARIAGVSCIRLRSCFSCPPPPYARPSLP